MPVKPSEIIKSGGNLLAEDTAYYGNNESFQLEICTYRDPENPSAEEIMLMDLDQANEEALDELFNADSLYEFLQHDNHAAEFNDGSLVQANLSMSSLEYYDGEGRLLSVKDNKRVGLKEIIHDYGISTESQIDRQDLGYYLDNYLN